jgi:DNA-directed RNA polymerase specialized sigma24 family protein
VAARRTIDLTRMAAGPMDRLPAEEIADKRPPPPDAETLERLEQIVARFPPEWRQLWDWWVQGVPREDMASRLGKSLRTIQYRLAEMLDQVRQGLSLE